MDLRPRQTEAIDAVVQSYLDGIYQQLIVMATGTGKTVIFGNLWNRLVQYLPGRMLVLAHREELIDQAQRTLQLNNPSIKVGKEMAEYRADLDCKIIVSCVASIGRMDSKRLERFGLDTFDKVICDEAHHSIASTYMNVFEALGLLKPESKKLLVGFTATPKRKNLTRAQKKQVTTLDDESLLSLKSVYKKIVFSYPMRQAIKEGWLVPLRGFKVKTESSLDNIRMVAGDFKQDELAATVNVDDRNLQVIKAYKEFGEGRQTVGFTVDIAHAQALAKMSRDYGIKAEAVWGNDPDRVRNLLSIRAKTSRCSTTHKYSRRATMIGVSHASSKLHLQRVQRNIRRQLAEVHASKKALVIYWRLLKIAPWCLKRKIVLSLIWLTIPRDAALLLSFLS